jgi:hypothetical protein
LRIKTAVAQLYGEVFTDVDVYKQQNALRACLLDDVTKMRAHLVAAGADAFKILVLVRNIIKVTPVIPLLTPPRYLQDLADIARDLTEIIQQQKLFAPAAPLAPAAVAPNAALFAAAPATPVAVPSFAAELKPPAPTGSIN